MKLARWLKAVFIFMAGGLLWILYGLDSAWSWSWIFLALGLLWLFARRLNFWYLPSVGLAVFILAAVAGLQFGYPAIWMIAAVSISLAAWDLSEFEQRLRDQVQEQSLDTLAYQHLKKLLLTIGLGALAAIAATYLRFQLSFWVVFLLGLGITAILGWTFQRLLRSESPETNQ